MIRKAVPADLAAIEAIYSATHTAEEQGFTSVGWVRSVYPTRKTAEDALKRQDLFVLEDGEIVGCAIINQLQVDVYTDAPWQHPAADEQVMVLHTLVIHPEKRGMGYGRQFVTAYEEYAKAMGCPFLRMDTNAKNTQARAMYKKLGYLEITIVPCRFNGIEGVQLVLLEKYLR